MPFTFHVSRRIAQSCRFAMVVLTAFAATQCQITEPTAFRPSTTFASASPPALFQSDWSTATGSGASASSDGGKWTGNLHPEDFTVIAKGADPGAGTWPSTLSNILDMKVTTAGHSNALYIANAYSGPSTAGSLYYRAYLRVAVPENLTSNSNHYMEPQSGTCAYQGEWLLLFHADGTFGLRLHTNGGYWDMQGANLSQSAVYRLEWQLYKVSGVDSWNVHVRISDATDTQVKGDADFQANFGTSAFLSSTPTVVLTEGCQAGNFQIGANGDTPTVDRHVYWGGVMVRNDTWSGPYRQGQ